MKTVKIKETGPRNPRICGKRPSVAQNIFNPMAPPCTLLPKHTGPHAWATAKWRIK